MTRARWPGTDALERLRSAAARLFRNGHARAVLALVAVHFVVFCRSLLTAPGGALYTHVPYDFQDSYHRYLIYLSDCLRAGEAPLWYPYGGAGIPFFLNPQTQLWSPVTWLVTLAFGYSHHVAQRQLVWTLLVAGLGAYVLAHELWRSKMGGFLSGVCFMLSGALFTNAQHMDIINAFALTPWLFFSLCLLARSHMRAVPLAALVFLLLLTSGYPGVVLMLALWALAFTAYLAIVRLEASERSRFLLALTAAGALSLLLGAGHWLPIAANLHQFSRGKPLELMQALSGGLHFPHFWGLVFPFTWDTVWPGFAPDPSMKGLYIGVLSVPLLVACASRARERWVGIVFGAGLLALLASTGYHFFGRIFLNLALPFLNLSRFPAADSRAFAALMLALLLAPGARAILADFDGLKPLLRRAFVGLLVFLPVLVVVFKLTLLASVDAAVFNDQVVGFVTAQMLLVAGGWFLTQQAASGRAFLLGMGALLAVDLGNGVLQGYRMIGLPVSEEAHRAEEAEHATTFSPQAAMEPRVRLSENLQAVAANRGYTAKRFFLDDYSPFRLRSFEQLIARGFADWLVQGERVVAVPPERAHFDPAMLAAPEAAVDYRIDRYTCGQVDYEVTLQRDALLVFNEVYFDGWQATLDGAPVPVESAGGLRSLRVPAGTHRVHTIFAPRIFFYGAGLSALGWLILLGWTALLLLRQKRTPSS